MMKAMQKLGVQSFCFRALKDNSIVAQKVVELGLTSIELCGVHVNFADENSFDQVIEIYRNSGIEIASIGVQQFKGDLVSEEKYFQFAHKAGARTISANGPVDFDLKNFKQAERLAERYEINLAIHNHGGKHWLGSSAVLGEVFSRLSRRVGLMLDTAWALDAGEDPVAMADRFAERLYGIHLKDFVFARSRKPEDVVIGTGNLKLPELYQVLKNKGFSGKIFLEYEGDVENPVPALKECLQNLEQFRG